MGYTFHPRPVMLKDPGVQRHIYPDDRFQSTVLEEDPEVTRWGQINVPLYDSHFADIFNYHNDIRFFHGLDDWDFHVYLDKVRRLDFCKRTSFSMPVSTFFGSGFNNMRLAILEVVPYRSPSRMPGYGESHGFISPGLYVTRNPWICKPIEPSGDQFIRWFDSTPGVPPEIDILGLTGSFPNVWEGIVFYTRARVNGKWCHLMAVSERFNIDTFDADQTSDYVPYTNPEEDDGMWKTHSSEYSGGYHGLVEARTAFLQEVEISEEEQEVMIFTLEGEYSGKKMKFKLPRIPENHAAVFFVGFKKFQGERRLFWRLSESPNNPMGGVIGNNPHMPENGEFLAETFSMEVFGDWVLYQNSTLHPFSHLLDPPPSTEGIGNFWGASRGIHPVTQSNLTINPLAHYLVMSADGYHNVNIRARHGLSPWNLQHVARKVEFYSGSKSEFMFDGTKVSTWTGTPHLCGLPSNFRDYFREARESILDLIDQGCLTMAAEDYRTTMKATTISSLHEYLDWKYNQGRFWGNISPEEESPFPDRGIPDPYEEEEGGEPEEEEEEVGWAEPLEAIGDSYVQQTYEYEYQGEPQTAIRIIHGPKDISYDELIPFNVNDAHIRMYFGADCIAFRYRDEAIRDVEDNINLAHLMVDSVIGHLDNLLQGKEDIFIAAYFGEPWEGHFSYARTTWNTGEIQHKIENFWGYQPGGDPEDMDIYYWENVTPLAFLHDMVSVRGLTINDEFETDIPYSSYNGECYAIGVCPISWTTKWDPAPGEYGGWSTGVCYTDAYDKYYTNGYTGPVTVAKRANIRLYCLYRYWGGAEASCQTYCDETGGELRTV